MLRYGLASGARQIFEGHKCESYRDDGGKLRIASANIMNPTGSLDVSWLPVAAEKYCISPNINDYVIAEVPIVTVNVPNRNLDEFPYEEISGFNPDFGKFVYKTFDGKPCYRDHDNRDYRKARGVHLDSSLERMPDGNYKIVVLTAWDRTKDKSLVNDILTGKRTGFSMGALVSHTVCSYPGCGAEASNGRIACSHMDGGRSKGRVINGYLVYERCYGVQYIETSSVEDPADHTAHGRWLQAWK